MPRQAAIRRDEKGDISPFQGMNVNLPEPDVLHLSAAGHQRYAEAIFQPIFNGVTQVITELKNV